MADYNDSKINLGIPQLPADSLPSSLYPTFLQIYLAFQNLLRGISQYTGIDAPASNTWSQLSWQDTVLSGNLTRIYPIAGVAIARGQIINLYDNAGTINARLANASSSTTMAHGIANSAANIGEQLEAYWLRAAIDSIGGMTVGTLYYLSTIAGAVQPTPPVTPGEIVQPIGLAVEPATLLMDIPLSFIQL